MEGLAAAGSIYGTIVLVRSEISEFLGQCLFDRVQSSLEKAEEAVVSFFIFFLLNVAELLRFVHLFLSVSCFAGRSQLG